MPDESPTVLVLANRLPFPVDDGWKTRTYHIIRGLAEHARVSLLTFHDGPASTTAAFRDEMDDRVDVVTVPTPRRHSPVRLLLGLLTSTPIYVWNFRSRRFARELHGLVARRQPDAVIAELTCMYPYLQGLPRTVRRVIDTHNIDSALLSRYAATHRGPLVRSYAVVTARKLRAFEGRAFAEADLVWVCSEEDARLARGIAPPARVVTVPNGVDTVRFAPADASMRVPNRLFFFGRMDYEPNRDAIHYFAREILPELLVLEPDVELHVAGAGIDSGLERLAASNPAIRLAGRLDDVRPALAEASVVVVPLRMGGGTRLKILEAFAAAKPVVSTTVGAEGLDVASGQELLVADSAADFARAVSRLLRDAELQRRLGQEARRTAERLYDWRRIRHAAAATLWPAARLTAG